MRKSCGCRTQKRPKVVPAKPTAPPSPSPLTPFTSLPTAAPTLLRLVIVVLILNNTLAYRSQNKSINGMLHKTAEHRYTNTNTDTDTDT